MKQQRENPESTDGKKSAKNSVTRRSSVQKQRAVSPRQDREIAERVRDIFDDVVKKTKNKSIKEFIDKENFPFHFNAVYDATNGRTYPSVKMMVELHSRYAVNINWVLTGGKGEKWDDHGLVDELRKQLRDKDELLEVYRAVRK